MRAGDIYQSRGNPTLKIQLISFFNGFVNFIWIDTGSHDKEDIKHFSNYFEPDTAKATSFLDKAFPGFKNDWSEYAPPSCSHEMINYIGFTAAYSFCKKCDYKEII